MFHRTKPRKFLFLLVTMLVIFALPTFVGAQGESPPADISFNGLVDAYGAVTEVLPGLGFTLMLLSGATNLLKRKLGDGKATQIYNVLMAVTIGLLTIVKLFLPSVNFGYWDGLARTLVENFAVMAPAALVVLKMLSPKMYEAIKGLPYIGFSYSLESSKLPEAKQAPYLG